MVEVQCEHMYFSEDLTYISGITDTIYGLVNGQPIYLCVNDSSEMVEYQIEVKTVTRQGYVVFNQTYNVFNEDGDKGIIFADGNKYVSKGNNSVIINSYMFEGEENEIPLNEDSVQIPTRHYIEDGYVSISGIKYAVDVKFDGFVYIKNNTPLLIQGKEAIKDIVHFVIRKNINYKLNIENMSCTKEYKYITSSVTENEMVVNKRLYLNQSYINGDIHYSLSGNNTLINKGITDVFVDSIMINGYAYKLYSEWRNTTNGNHAHLYLKDHQDITEGQIIKITPQSTSECWVALDNDETVNFNGKKYSISSEKQYLQYPKLDGEVNELLIHFTKDNWEGELTSGTSSYGYAMLDNSPFLIQVGSDGETAIRKIEDFAQNESSYKVKTYKFINIEGKEYKVIENNLVRNGEVITERGILIADNNPIRLFVENIVSGNQLRCQVLNGEDVNSGILYQISINIEKFIFELENQLFSPQMVDNLPTVDRDYIYDTYKIYKPTDYIVVPMQFSNNVANNLHQEYILENEFFNKESEKSINRIIDMEKNIYYPAYENYDSYTQTFKYELIDELVFDLHFRSRDLETWAINDDYDDKKTWNIFDYYNNTLKPTLEHDTFNYYQPADLLYFLGFTDNDVFYQKSKIGKTFLRLSFYDSNNPMKQHLLYTSTIFMDEGKYYKTYIDNSIGDGDYISINEIDKESQRIYSKTISTMYDTYDTEKQIVTCESDKRLAASFSIKNMFESKESSEGFYMYLFKEFNNGLRERTIYMTVEFNHAGYGKTVKFMQPYNGDGESKSMVLGEEREEFMNGYPLNKIYNYLYIPINIKYDDKLKKYIYYLPNWLCMNEDKNVMRFSLYELKIKDETLNS